MTRKRRILLADDEPALRSIIGKSLEKSGFEVLLAADGREALDIFEREPTDLVLLDIIMPEVDGFTVCQEIRKRSDVPVVMLTALGDTNSIVKGFHLGADDYICKPFKFQELKARIEAILRRVQWFEKREPPQIITIGGVSIDAGTHEVKVNGKPVHLTPIEFGLLHYLMARPGQAISKETLFHEVWGYSFVGETNLVEVAVRRLREKIEPAPSDPQYILTVRGVGYKFVSRIPERPE